MGGQGCQLMAGRGRVQGTPTYILQNDRHDVLIILRVCILGSELFCSQTFFPSQEGSQQLGWVGRWGWGSSLFLMLYHHF